jgi:hypothetical protein
MTIIHAVNLLNYIRLAIVYRGELEFGKYGSDFEVPVIHFGMNYV